MSFGRVAWSSFRCHYKHSPAPITGLPLTNTKKRLIWPTVQTGLDVKKKKKKKKKKKSPSVMGLPSIDLDASLLA